ncbi:MAG: UDP-glucose/GDP-mannose dehydrogenase family protein [Microbacteriaceae bacterium]|nr:UDP-glucose/GDP-mannose dehydrogenase family protein [Microbacteriaceae bacterium]
MRISVVGCGYLGAVHAAAMASIGHDVVGIDVDPEKIARLGRGEPPFHEPGFDALLREQVESGRLRFTTDFAEARAADVHFLAVGTPQARDGRAADVSYVNAAVASLAPVLRPGAVVAGKSTVPVGTAARLAPAVEAAGATLVWNPEFLREGFAVQDTLEPDRLVYGINHAVDGRAPEESPEARILDEVYAPIVGRGTPRIVTDWATAELVKVSANAFLATKISFINAMAEIAEATGADVTTLADAIGMDARIGRRFLNAGVGFGGGCLPKDIRAFGARAEELGLGASVAFLKEIDAINMRRRDRVVDLVLYALGPRRHEGRVTVLGLAFKPDSDDVRDSPALDVAVRLKGLGVHVVATDPEAIENARARHPQLEYVADTQEALAGADVVVLVTEWREFRELDPAATLALASDGASTESDVPRPPVVIDGRNVLDPVAWRAAGWDYRGMGRP